MLTAAFTDSVAAIHLRKSPFSPSESASIRRIALQNLFGKTL